ncbi:MAG: acyclic terpene utilization AtuA family protein [Chloroflexota bacterium]
MAEPKVVRFGEGAGTSGAWIKPAIDLAIRGRLDYLSFECLAERTVALDQLARLKNPESGYDPYLDQRMRLALPPCWAQGTKVVTNMGAANPAAAGRRIVAIARELGLKGLRVGVVVGDDVLGTLDRDALVVSETGERLNALGDRLVSANAYLGAEPIVAALAAGAHVVVGGRFADPSLALASLRHALGWRADDWELLGAGICFGHLTECGPQVTGGYFLDHARKAVRHPENVGYPIAEVRADGSGVITKLDGTGGTVSEATCTEQLIYEVHDPSAYLTPDVTADFSGVTFAQEGPDRVRVHGAKGRPMPATLKATVGYRDGYIGEGQISYAGTDCLKRARLAADVVLARLENLGVRPREVKVDYIGVDSIFGPAFAQPAEPREVRLRVAARTHTREEAETVGGEVEGLWVGGPYGGGGVMRSVREIVAAGSVYLPREAVRTEMTVLEA